jgi:acetyltransferase
MVQYGSNLRALYETPLLLTESTEGIQPERVESILAQVRAAGRTLLTELEAKDVLTCYGIPVLQTRVTLHEAEAVGQRTISANAIELFLGKRIDPDFGPMILFGAGGHLAEVWRDRAIGFPPLNATLAKRLMERAQIYAPLKGSTGRPQADLDALEKTLIRFSQLVAEQPLLKQIDVNPLVASPKGAIAFNARMMLSEPGLTADSLSKLVIRPYPTEYVHSCILADGTPVTIRPVRPEDEPLMIDFHQALSEETLHLRYFGLLKHEDLVSHDRLLRICFSDYDREIALVVERSQPSPNNRQIIAVARLIKAHRANEAELAIVISDDWQRKGLGTKLLADLYEIGRAEGLERIFGHILPGNYVMKRICRKLGFELRYDASEDAIRAEIELRSRC